MCDMIGRPDLKDNPAFSTPEARREHQQDLLAILSGWTATQPKEEIYHLLQELRSVAGYVATVEDLFSSRQLVATVFPGDRPSRCWQSSISWRPFSHSGDAWRHGRAPLLGEHNWEIYGGRLGLNWRISHAFVGQGLSDLSPPRTDASAHDENDGEH